MCALFELWTASLFLAVAEGSGWAGPIYIFLFLFSALFSLGAFIFGHDGTDHDAGGDHGGDGDHGMPSVFSTRVISLFLLGFSGMGIIGHYAWHLSDGFTALLGIGSGVIMGAIAYLFVAIFYREQASSMAEPADYRDIEGRISSAIPEGGTGEVSVVVKGQLRTIFAVSESGSRIPEGRTVKIVSMAGGTATVREIT